MSEPPEHVLLAWLCFASATPAGSVSENAIPVRPALAFGFRIAKSSVAVVPRAIDPGVNFFAMEGGRPTNIDADAGAPLPPSAELIAPVVLG